MIVLIPRGKRVEKALSLGVRVQIVFLTLGIFTLLQVDGNHDMLGHKEKLEWAFHISFLHFHFKKSHLSRAASQKGREKERYVKNYQHVSPSLPLLFLAAGCPQEENTKTLYLS